MCRRSISLALAIILLSFTVNLIAQVPEKLVVRRFAIERVTVDYRTGSLNTFEEAMSRQLLKQLARLDIKPIFVDSDLRRGFAIDKNLHVEQHKQENGDPEPEFYYKELRPDTRRALGLQLQNPGYVSAVAGQSGYLQVFLLEERNQDKIRVILLSMQKRGYEEWLGSQPQM